MPPRIAIIGAGPAGLTLARLLQHNGVPCTVYEQDMSREARSQAGSLDIHEGSGQLAIREAGLWGEFVKVMRPEADMVRLCDPSGHAWIDENKKPRKSHDRPQIDRRDLRNLLLDSIDAASVHRGRRLERAVPVSKDTYDLHFATGPSARGFNLVVGADGAWSKVRPLLTSATPFYSGISAVGMVMESVAERKPELSNLVGAGSCFVIGENSAIIAQSSGDRNLRTWAYRRAAESWLQDCGIDWSNSKGARAELVKRHYADWREEYKDLILQSNDQLDARPLYMLPIGLEWAPRPGVTLLGDAAHLMTPFAGVGVNLGMHDALELGRAIIARRQSWPSSSVFTDANLLAAAIHDHEILMFERGEKYAQRTWDNLQSFFSDGGIKGVMTAMKA